MESFVRYSVAVYVGLLLAGAAIYPNDVQISPAASADTMWYRTPEIQTGVRAHEQLSIEAPTQVAMEPQTIAHDDKTTSR